MKAEKRILLSVPHMGEPSGDMWNPRLRAKLATGWHRFEGAILEVAQNRVEVCIKVGRKHLNADLVDAGRAPVALDRFKSGAHQFRGDSSGKRVSFDFAGNEQFHDLS